jgi:hypothetical protein
MRHDAAGRSAYANERPKMKKHKKTKYAIGNNRLIRLAKFLDTLPPERFDYGRFVGDGWEGKQDLSCGTTACALGWAATMPEFRALGLRLVANGYGHDFVTNMWNDSAFFAASELFETTLEQARYLFGGDVTLRVELHGLPYQPATSATPRQVADHLRAFVAWRRKRG